MSGRARRLAPLADIDDDTTVELSIAHRLGFDPFPEGGSGAREWDRLHAWERAILLRGQLVHEQRQRAALVADVCEVVVPILANAIGEQVATTILTMLGHRPATTTTDSRVTTVEADETREDRAAALAGKIRARGGTVPGDASGGDAQPAASKLGIRVREV